MRELHAWRGGHRHHGEHRRHAQDAATAADDPGRQARGRARDAAEHGARDALKLKMLLDPEARKDERLRYRQKVEATEADYAARHARPKAGDQGRAPGQLKPREPKPEHAHPEALDKPAGKITERTKPPERQEQKQRKPERSRLPANDTTQLVAGIGVALSSLADALNVLPGRWDAVLTSFLGAAVASVAWGNRRWKDKHANRPED